MSQILSLTLPIFLLIALGFAAVRMGVLEAAFIGGLGKFVLNFALPALILHALTAQDLRQTFNANYLAVYAVGSLIVFGLAFALARLLFRAGLSKAAMAALGSSCSNSGFIGFPIASLATGGAALVALPMTMLVENVVIIPLALTLAELGLQRGDRPAALARGTLLRLTRMPLIWAIVLGALLSFGGLRLPTPLSTAVGLVADASVACALFVVGGTLALQKRIAVDATVFPILVGKLLLHPFVVAAGFLLIDGVPRDLQVAGIVLASAPMLTVYPILGERFGQGTLCATALVIVTAAGFITMTLVLASVGFPTP